MKTIEGRPSPRTSENALGLTSLDRPPVDAAEFLASTDVFRGLSGDALADIGASVEWLQALGGQVLFREGEPGDAVYIVVSGRLIAYVHAVEGGERRLREIGRGGNVGEIALLTDEPRSASVRAVRDTTLARLSRARFVELLARHPDAMQPLTRTLARWLSHSHRAPSRGMAAGTVALVPLAPDVPLDALATQLCEVLAAQGRTLRIDAGFVARQMGAAHLEQASVSAWLDELEIAHRFLLYQGDSGASEWTRRCVRQADRRVFVGMARGDPREAQRVLARLLGDTGGDGSREELVLLHAQRTPADTAAWLKLRPFAAHHHVRVGDARDLGRLARRLTGQSIGVVLSGGGARGFAHIGVLRALEEAGIPIDRVGGASMGAVVGALYASGLSPAELVEANRIWQRENPHRQVTLPMISLVSGEVGTKIAGQLFGDRRIEDLWLDYFCVSTDLSESRLAVHHDGPVARWVLASASIPGVSPPVLSDGGGLLVDGALLNNLPADVMAHLEEGYRIAVDVASAEKLSAEDYAEAGSLWTRLRMLGASVLTLAAPPRVPNIFKILYASTLVSSRSLSERFRDEVDLYLSPPVSSFGIFDWQALDRLAEVGFRYARAQLAAWEGAAALRVLGGVGKESRSRSGRRRLRGDAE